jgi:hypothetical protein
VKGIQFSNDKENEPKFVVIDVQKNAELWEDFYDYLILRDRRNEPSIRFEKVQQKLLKKRKKARPSK